ncbi:hypothetical protein [Paenibacillus sp. BAC0078]
MSAPNNSLESGDTVIDLPLGKGRLIWCPLPLELNDHDEPITELYRLLWSTHLFLRSWSRSAAATCRESTGASWILREEHFIFSYPNMPGTLTLRLETQ